MSNVIEALVSAGIDVKLNKTDLIEMLVVEREESLELAISQANDLNKKSQTELDGLLTKYSNSRIAAGERVSKSLVKSLAKVFDFGKHEPKVKIQLCGSFTFEGKQELANVLSLACSRVKISQDYYSPGLTKLKLEVSKGGSSNLISSKLQDVPLSATEQKLRDRMLKAAQLHKDNVKALQSLNHELHSLNKMGKRAKAKLVKEFLCSSEQGKSLMESMTKISKVKLLK